MYLCPQCGCCVRTVFLHHGALYCADCLPAAHPFDPPAMRAHITHLKARSARHSRSPTDVSRFTPTPRFSRHPGLAADMQPPRGTGRPRVAIRTVTAPPRFVAAADLFLCSGPVVAAFIPAAVTAPLSTGVPL